MKSIDVVLGIARSSANAQTLSGPDQDKVAARQAGGLNPDLRQKIFERDDHTCRCCGFRSQKYQDVIFLNGNLSDIRLDNMATACIFCHQCFYLDQVVVMRSGVLIWLPELTQEQLHHAARAIYVARISQGPVADAARKSLDILMQRRADVRQRLGTDDPYILATVLKDYISTKSYEARRAKLEGVRLFPLDRRIIKEADLEFNQFPQILAYWRSKEGPFGTRLPRQWIDLYKDLGRPGGAKSAA